MKEAFYETGTEKLLRKLILMLLPIIGLFKHICPTFSSSDSSRKLRLNGGKYTRWILNSFMYDVEEQNVAMLGKVMILLKTE